jgi:hypothetical protein
VRQLLALTRYETAELLLAVQSRHSVLISQAPITRPECRQIVQGQILDGVDDGPDVQDDLRRRMERVGMDEKLRDWNQRLLAPTIRRWADS